MAMEAETSNLSVSIVTYNTAAPTLELVLACVASSTISASVSVVDNSWRPDLEQTARKYRATYLHTGENLGYGRAHNLAIRQLGSRSRYHLILNPDVTFGSLVLEDLCSVMEANPQIGWIMPKIVYPDGTDQHLCKRLPTPADLFIRRFAAIGIGPLARAMDRFECRDVDLSQPCVVPNLSGCFALLRTDLLKEVGGFDERFFLYLEDTDLVRRIGERSRTVFYPLVTAYHAHGRGSYKNLRLLGRHIYSAVQYFSKWGWFFDSGRSVKNRALDSGASWIVIPHTTQNLPTIVAHSKQEHLEQRCAT